MQSYEVEIKSLLGGSERAEELRRAMKKLDPGCELLAVSRQLNHYFEPSAPHGEKQPIERLREEIYPLIEKSAVARLHDLATRATSYTVRTRLSEKNNAKTVYLVVKASIDANSRGLADGGAASRVEFEEKVALPLQELDELVMSCGFRYQAKWSRQREEYVCLGITVTLDKNAGYGWLAEFERVVDDADKVDQAEDAVRELMRKLKVQELPQERLERMFAHYNEHWQDYYGTENIFVVE